MLNFMIYAARCHIRYVFVCQFVLELEMSYSNWPAVYAIVILPYHNSSTAAPSYAGLIIDGGW